MKKSEFEKKLNNYFENSSISVSNEEKRIYIDENPTRLKYNKIPANELDSESYLKQNIDLIKYFYFREDISNLKFLPNH